MDRQWLENKVARLLRFNVAIIQVQKLDDEMIRLKIISDEWPENTLVKRYQYADAALKHEPWYKDRLVILKCFDYEDEMRLL